MLFLRCITTRLKFFNKYLNFFSYDHTDKTIYSTFYGGLYKNITSEEILSRELEGNIEYIGQLPSFVPKIFVDK